MYPSLSAPLKSRKRLIVSTLRSKYPYFVVKRVVDVVFSVFLLLLVYSWLMPLLAILITLDSRGPLFFRQQRIGFLGKPFICIKFRTMYVNLAADLQQATVADPRVTRVGRFLRRTGLDELPQLFSVLRGDMSLIGPRPHMLRDIEAFSAVVRNYNFRHLVRPGITGIAQVKGYRGLSETIESIYRRYQWDEYYVCNINAGLDAKIFWGTVVLTVRCIFNRSVQQDAPVVLSSTEAPRAAMMPERSAATPL
ncbi:sugar transferase [Dinghuibacter silviterrae]|uniref:Putative colanic acid biosynthesis UDP-glucose lipid carrier transferase n=1 Tax=Dinghuibacter silviterrae TaxID=1539049 RepID=A0A4R8DVK6_9BACT|nr:sugar transferase [Dinghuibacter silviterrae]TDX01958.1 putative colanic acid biosynthesis UDP-glucose lipid carrier transferase [Dinghuibacter silviterrae]